MRLAQNVAIVTGAGRGIGRAIALRLSEEGAHVALTARTNEQLAETASMIEEAGGICAVIPGDVTREAEVKHIVEETTAELGPVTILVNNAGRLGALGPTWEQDADNWWQDMTVNVKGVFHYIRAVLPGMMERNEGRIINAVGGGTSTPFPFASGYGTSKAAVMRLTETLAAELEEVDSAVKVFAFSPGFVRTEMTEPFEETEEGRKWMGRLAKRLEESEDTPPEAGARLVAELATGDFDAMHGRMFHAERDLSRIEELKAQADEMAGEDRRALRIVW